MKTVPLVPACAAACVALAAGPAAAVTLTFDDLAAGTTLASQYSALGAVFAANALSGASGSGSSTPTWATNTDMTIASLGGDVGGVGSPALVSGNLLHSQGGWLNENGDPSFRITFSRAATAFSIDVAGVTLHAATRVFVYNGSTLLATVSNTTTTNEQYTLSYNTLPFTSVVVAPGSSDDWVGVDNVNFTLTPVPEPASWATLGAGLGAVLLALRRRRA